VINMSSSQISGYVTGFVRPFVGLSDMNYVEYLSAVKLNYTIREYQFSSTSDQAMLHVVQCVCVKRALAIKENTHQQNIISSKWTLFCSHIMSYSVLITLVKKISKMISGV